MNRQKGELNRSPLPKHIVKKDPGPTHYDTNKVSFKQEEKTLSNIHKDISYKIHYNKEAKGGPNLKRFIDIHKKNKEWVPGV